MASPQQQSQAQLDSLKAEIAGPAFRDDVLSKKLLALKISARDPEATPGVYSKDGLAVLAETALGKDAAKRPLSSLEAAKVIANALLLRPDLQEIFAALGFTENLIIFYQKDNYDHEFVGARILFLLTYKSKTDFVHLIEKKQLAQCMTDKLNGHLEAIRKARADPAQMEVMAMTETLKLLYNLSSKCPEQMSFFARSVESLVHLVTEMKVEESPLSPPMSQLLNALAIIEWSASAEKELIDISLPCAQRLVHITDAITLSTSPTELETQMIPLLTVMRKVNALFHDQTTEILRVHLLPQDEERNQPLGKSQSLASRLLRLQTSGGLMNLPEAISGLLFELSDSDASKFVHNIGYGHAAGYLMTHKISIPRDIGTPDGINASPVNPITGQRLDAETPVTMPEMTDEEKEREAERLFVLFERLRATGVVRAENPVRTAQQSGRFEEVSDDD